MTARRVIVIGGGLAGITAAIGLRDAGLDVTLLEARPRLGGAASSFRRGELTIDNGQHVFLRCCSEYQGLLARLGVSDSVLVQPRFDVTVLAPADGSGPRAARLRRTALPGPLHMLRALAGYRLLTPAQRLRVGRAAMALRFADPADARLDSARLGDWLAARGQDEPTRRMLWDLFIVSALNIAGDDASVPLAATVIKTALLGARDAADIGVAAVPLGDLHGGAAAALLGRLGARVRLAARVTGIERSGGGGFGVRIASGDQHDYGGEREPGSGGSARDRETAAGRLLADGVVLAVPAAQAARLAGQAGVAGAGAWTALGGSPIVNLHVIYDRRVTRLPFAAAVRSPVQWVFDKTRQAGLRSGQYLAVSLSAADEYIDVPVAELRERFLPALAEIFPDAAGARVADFFVTRERRATFRQGPGTAALRPGSGTGIPGLALAGAWTETGWPDTMEGAVRSGHNGAQVLIGQLMDGAAGQAPAGAVSAAALSPRSGAVS